MDIRIISVKQTSQISHTRVGTGQSGYRDIPIVPVEGYPRSAEIRADRALDDPSGEDEEVTRCKCCIYTKVKAKGAHRGDDSAQVAK